MTGPRGAALSASAQASRTPSVAPQSEAGWLDPPNPRHSCYDEMPNPLTREDWQRRWRCSCGKFYRVADSQRDGYYFEPLTQGESDV